MPLNLFILQNKAIYNEKIQESHRSKYTRGHEKVVIELCCKPVRLIRDEEGNSKVNQEGVQREDPGIFLKRQSDAVQEEEAYRKGIEEGKV
jgi:hypothetical protein